MGPIHTSVRILRLVASGAVKPAIDRRFTLDQVVDALTYVHEGRPRGKVLVISPGSSGADQGDGAVPAQ